MTDPDILNRARGCAAGAAIGDALGMPLEFGPAQPANALVRQMQAGRLPAGTFTDDTEMALALAESLQERRPLTGDILARHFVRWLRGYPDDVGIQTRQALNWIAQGQSWQQASAAIRKQMPDGAGNGSLMRCWPVALVWWNNPAQLVTDSRLQSEITHPHPDCQDASALLNLIIAGLVGGLTPREALQSGLAAVPLAPDFRQLVDQAPSRQRGQLKNTGWVRHTLESALWGLLTTTSFSEAVIQVVNLGGDADTAGAVTGALAGAAYGLEAIPAEWKAQLQGEWPMRSGRRWKVDQIIKLADKLVQ